MKENKEKLYLHINVVMDRSTDKQEYLWNKVSSYLESMGMKCLGSSEYQPLDRIPEETRPTGEKEEFKENIDRLEELAHDLIMATIEENDIAKKNAWDEFRGTKEFILFIVQSIIDEEVSQARKEGYQDCLDDIWEEAKGLRGWAEHDGNVSATDIEAGLQEAYLNIEESRREIS